METGAGAASLPGPPAALKPFPCHMETTAWNVRPSGHGRILIGEGTPDIRPATLPLQEIEGAIRSVGVPVCLSNYA